MTSNTYNDTNTHNPMSGNATHNTHNPFTGDGVVNTHNPLTGDKTGPHPPPGTNPITGRTKDGELGRNEQQHPGAGHTGAGITSGTNTHNAHNTHNPMTGNGVTNTHNPMTGDATGPHPTSGATHTGAGHVGTTGTNTHNTHNPLTSDGVHNTHNPMTGDKTGPNPPPGTNPMTGRTHDGNLGRHEQHGVGHTGMTGTGPDTTTGITGTHTGAGNVGTMGSGSHNTHNTHNPLTGDGVNNTHNPVTGDKTGPHPPAGTNPVTGRTNEGDLGRHDQRGVGQTGVTGTNPTAVRDTTHGTHTTGTHTGTHTGAHTGAHTTSNQTSGGGAKAIIGKVEATLGNMLKNPDMHAKGVQKQEEAAAAKAARTEGNATHTGTGTNLPPHAAAIGTAEEPRH